MSKESKFCLSNLVGVKVKYCGETTIACDQGYVIDVVEVEKGDTSTCIFTYNECSDETSFNQEWTDLMREHCNGKRKCDTYKVEDEEERAIKTIYNCTQKHPPTRPTKPTITIDLDTNASVPYTQTTQPHTSFIQSTSNHLMSPSEDDVFPRSTTVAISTISIVAVVMVIIVLLLCRKRGQRMRKHDNHSNPEASRPRNEYTEVAEGEEILQLQPVENSQYENSDIVSRRITIEREDSPTSGQPESDQYDHVGIGCQNQQQPTENVYNIANFNVAEQNEEGAYNNASYKAPVCYNDNEYAVATGGAQICVMDNEYNIANHTAQAITDNGNVYNVAYIDTQCPILENEYNVTN